MTSNGEMYLAGETKTKGDFEQKKHKLDRHGQTKPNEPYMVRLQHR